MSQELLYTSAPRGLKPGSRGFCTVLSTQGMAAPLTTALEGLSGYRPVYPTGDDRADRNPVVYSHLKLQSSGRAVNVLSRIADFGLDYSQRANKLAHHVVLDRTELLPGGPANLLSMRDFMRDEWSGEPTVIALKPVKRETDPPSGVCRAWQELTGDAGWAGVLAESFLQAPDRLVMLLFAPGQDILPLFHEAISLLPVERRWDVTFSTYFTGLATGTTCSWRAIVQDSKDAHESLRFVNALRLDLTSRSLGRATGGPLVDAARSGSRPHNTPGRATSRTGPADVTFAEAERVHVEFSSEDRTPASFRRTVASPQPVKQPQAQSAPPQQPPLEREPSYKMLPATTSSAPQSRPPRSLADVIEAESHRPAAGLGMWLGLAALALSFAALLSVVFMRPARDNNDRGQLANDPPAPIKAPTPPALNPKVESKAPARNDKPTEVATNTPSTEPPVAANTPTATDATASVSKPEGTTPVTISAGMPAEPAKPETPVATVRTEIKPEPLTLPTEGVSVPLHQFKRVEGKPSPIMVLMRPAWLPIVDKKPTPASASSNEAKFRVVRSFKEDVSDGVPSTIVASFTEYDDPDGNVKCALKSGSTDLLPWLGWCRVHVYADSSESHPLSIFAFDSFSLDKDEKVIFPLGKDEKFIGRQFDKNQHLEWKLPASGRFQSPGRSLLPTLVLDRLRLKIGGQPFLIKTDRDSLASSSWTCPLDDVTKHVLESFPGIAGPAKIKLELQIKLDPKNEGPLISLQVTGVSNFLSGIRSELKDRLFLPKTNTYKRCEVIWADEDRKKPTERLSQLKENLEKCSVANTKVLPEILKTIQEAISAGRRQLESESKEERKKQLKDAADDLAKLVPLYESVKKYSDLAASFNSITVVSARLSYKLSGTMNDATGKTDELTEDVDVVNFDDSKTGDSKQDSKKQPTAEKNGGNQ